MAFDDFHMRAGVCPPIGSCDFELGNLCSWSQDMSEDDFDWLLGSGATPGFNTGPKVDHTTNTTGGKHLYFIIGKIRFPIFIYLTLNVCSFQAARATPQLVHRKWIIKLLKPQTTRIHGSLTPKPW